MASPNSTREFAERRKKDYDLSGASASGGEDQSDKEDKESHNNSKVSVELSDEQAKKIQHVLLYNPQTRNSIEYAIVFLANDDPDHSWVLGLIYIDECKDLLRGISPHEFTKQDRKRLVQVEDEHGAVSRGAVISLCCTGKGKHWICSYAFN